MNPRRASLNAIKTALFVTPVLFFFAVYFLQVASSEDIHQGAGQPIAIIDDASSAFRWSARLGDMYAWPVINFFDYKYEFGVDTVFRITDVALATGIFVLMTYVILGRRPKWKIKDALVFGASFLAVFLSVYSRPIVSSFSNIHNYLFIALFSLLFLLPFAQQLRGKKLSPRLRNKLLMLAAGFLFAFSSNVTPMAFVATATLVVVYDRLVLKQRINIRKMLNSWQFFAVVGMLVALVIMYILGPGFSSYTHGYNNSYVSIKDLITYPATSWVALVSNIVHNFQSVVPELIIMTLVVLFEYVIYKKRLIHEYRKSKAGVRFSVICLIFFLIHVLAVSQINIPETGMSRILLPAYICAVVSVLFTINRILQVSKVQKRALAFIAVPVLLIISGITIDIGIVMVQHRQEATVVLDKIKYTKGREVCVTPADNPSAKSPILKYYQRELFADWAMPETIYGKQVNWCR